MLKSFLLSYSEPTTVVFFNIFDINAPQEKKKVFHQLINYFSIGQNIE